MLIGWYIYIYIYIYKPHKTQAFCGYIRVCIFIIFKKRKKERKNE